MKACEWEELMKQHPHWRVEEIVKGRFMVQNTRTNRCYEVKPFDDITLEEAEDILEGRREPVMLDTVTRIVGYYSSTSNWNRSKLGELEDRRKGDYSIPN